MKNNIFGRFLDNFQLISEQNNKIWNSFNPDLPLTDNLTSFFKEITNEFLEIPTEGQELYKWFNKIGIGFSDSQNHKLCKKIIFISFQLWDYFSTTNDKWTFIFYLTNDKKLFFYENEEEMVDKVPSVVKNYLEEYNKDYKEYPFWGFLHGKKIFSDIIEICCVKNKSHKKSVKNNYNTPILQIRFSPGNKKVDFIRILSDSKSVNFKFEDLWLFEQAEVPDLKQKFIRILELIFKHYGDITYSYEYPLIFDVDKVESIGSDLKTYFRTLGSLHVAVKGPLEPEEMKFFKSISRNLLKLLFSIPITIQFFRAFQKGIFRTAASSIMSHAFAHDIGSHALIHIAEDIRQENILLGKILRFSLFKRWILGNTNRYLWKCHRWGYR